jgi:purine nucleoside permease
MKPRYLRNELIGRRGVMLRYVLDVEGADKVDRRYLPENWPSIPPMLWPF